MPAPRIRMHDRGSRRGNDFTPLNPMFFDYYADPRALPRAIFFSRRHSPSPNHFPAALKNGPTRSLTAGDSSRQKHFFQLPSVTVAARPVSVARLPTPQNQRNTECSSVESFAFTFSVALR